MYVGGRSTSASHAWRYRLFALTPGSIFPSRREVCELMTDAPAREEYRRLWDQFLGALKEVPKSHRKALPMWLDHFDSAWLTFTHAIPSATAFNVKPDVSLYDHSKTTSALAVALWRWHQASGTDNQESVLGMRDRTDWATHKLLLIQGDFFGIQDFIFAEGSQTNKSAAKLLRGRSMQVSLMAELAALKVLEALDLPPTNQITNAAGKFLIVAPNTPDTLQKLESVRREFDGWFLKNSFGVAGIGLVWQSACCNDFVHKGKKVGGFADLMQRLFAQLDTAKLRRFDLCAIGNAVLQADYPHGPCAYQGRLPADQIKNDIASCALSRDQIQIGQLLTHCDRMLVLKDDAAIRSGGMDKLELPIFGYHIAFTGDQNKSGKFGELANSGCLLRCWDFSIPDHMDVLLWHGYARRYINSYVPRFDELDASRSAKYDKAQAEPEAEPVVGDIKTLNHLACEDRDEQQGRWQGQVGLMTLKGDVDNLGAIFRKGLEKPTFAKMAAMSRQMNAFFTVYIPALCATEFRNTYIVFAGGDDFFLIGPWHSTQKLAGRMAEKFRHYVAENPELHFSAGLVMTRPGAPMRYLGESADAALAQAKQGEKNAVTCFGETVAWKSWPAILDAESRLEELRRQYGLSTGYIYGLLHLLEQAKLAHEGSLEATLWRAHLAYRTRRFIVDKCSNLKTPEARQDAQTRLVGDIGERGIKQLGGKYRIALFNHLYRLR
jgi:CRISPR-associated protein Csm1